MRALALSLALSSFTAQAHTKTLALRAYPLAPSSGLVADKTQEFDNGNTFVMLSPDKSGQTMPLAYEDVRIPVPAALDANTTMELLLKVHAAKMAMAGSITVEGEKALPEVSLPAHLALEPLLATAGATAYCVHGQCTDLRAAQPRPHRPQAACKGGFYLSGDSHPALRNAVAAEMGAEAVGLAELLVRGHASLQTRTVFLFAAPQSDNANESLLATLGAAQGLLAAGACQVHLISPCLPYARSDKPEWDYSIATQGRLVADLLSYGGFTAVTVVRPHALQSMGFFSVPAFALPGRKAVNQYLATKGVELVVSPDAGFQKDATYYAQELGVGVAVINKQRGVGGDANIVSGSGLDAVAGKVVAVIDDETATGGTLAMSAKLLKQLGATKVYAVVTHLAGPAQRIIGNAVVDELVVTDTLPGLAGPRRISVASEIAEHIASLVK